MSSKSLFVPISFLAVLQNTTEELVDSDPVVFWRTAAQSVENTSLKSSVQRLLGLQWAVCLASCQMRTIQEFQVHAVYSYNPFGVMSLYSLFHQTKSWIQSFMISMALSVSNNSIFPEAEPTFE